MSWMEELSNKSGICVDVIEMVYTEKYDVFKDEQTARRLTEDWVTLYKNGMARQRR